MIYSYLLFTPDGHTLVMLVIKAGNIFMPVLAENSCYAGILNSLQDITMGLKLEQKVLRIKTNPF